MGTQTITLDELITKLTVINSQGFTKTTHPHQGGVGNTLETLLGIRENNLRIPDLGEIELKAKRLNSQSMLTLSSKSPLPKGSNRKLFEVYKTLREDGIYKLYTTIYGSRLNPRKFQVKVDDGNLTLVNPKKIEAYWPLVELDDVLKRGTKMVLLVLADTKGKFASKNEKFHYKEAYLLSGLSFERLKKALNDGKLKVDIRIGQDKTGKAAGKYHDHGTGFRISKGDYLHLFEKHEKILG